MRVYASPEAKKDEGLGIKVSYLGALGDLRSIPFGSQDRQEVGRLFLCGLTIFLVSPSQKDVQV